MLLNANSTNAPPISKDIKETYDKIVEEGIHDYESKPNSEKFKRTDGHNFLLRIQKHKESVLRFLDNSLIPFTNNQAEQDLRMMKVKQKISGGFRNSLGATVFCKIRGFISSCRKQNQRVFMSIQHIYA